MQQQQEQRRGGGVVHHFVVRFGPALAQQLKLYSLPSVQQAGLVFPSDSPADGSLNNIHRRGSSHNQFSPLISPLLFCDSSDLPRPVRH